VSRTLPNLNTETGAVPGHFVEPQLTQTMPRKMPSDTKSYNLDFLRASAVLFVFFGHLLQTLHIESMAGVITIYDMAQTGVLIFFVHTSLVLMLSLDRQHCLGRSLFSSFYVRRIFRIYPLAIVIVAIMIIGHVPPFPTQTYVPPSWTTTISNVALIQNLTRAPSLYAPLWSLPYEVQMYIVLPFLFVFFQKHWQGQWAAPALWALTALAIAVLAVLRLKGISLLYYFPCFLGGLVAYRLWFRGKRQLSFWGWPLVIAGCVLLRSAVGTFIGSRTVLPAGWIACLLLGWSVPLFREVQIRWLQTAASTVAKYSYGIYLSHALVLWLSFVVLKKAPFALQIGVWLVGSGALPVLLYHCIEDPMIKAGVKVTRSMTRASMPAEKGCVSELTQPAEM
jgi:peptidoglycan/LPS O-acetylase OafA/YrhL